MFLAFAFITIVASVFDKNTIEVDHIYNNYCDKYEPVNGVLKLDYSSFKDNNFRLRECKNIGDVEFQSGQIPPYSFYHSSITKLTLTKDTTGIGEGAFACCYNLKTVDFSADSEFDDDQIGEGAFCNSALDTILNFPSNLKIIQAYTFYGCPLNSTSIKTALQLSNSNLETISEKAFYGSNIIFIQFPTTLTEIEESAFENCKNLEIGGSSIDVSTIGPSAFFNSPKVTKIEITSISIGKNAFSCTTGNRRTINNIIKKTVNGLAQTLTIHDHAFQGCIIICNGIYTFEDLSIKSWAFAETQFQVSSNSNAEEFGIEIKNRYIGSPLEIGDYAFYKAKFESTQQRRFQLILSATKDTGNSKIGYHAFESSTGEFTLQIENEGSYEINDYAFYNSEIYTKKDSDDGMLIIPQCVSEIGSNSFANCQHLNGGVLVHSIIGDKAFYNCQSLSDKIILYGKDIGKSAFEGCTGSITNLNIIDEVDEDPTGGINIGDRAFYGCKNLKTRLVLHSFINSIGEYAFAYCTGLGSDPITIYAKTIQPYAFLGCETFSSPITIYSKEIKFHCFDRDTLKDLTFISNIEYNEDDEDSMNQIESYAFYDIQINGLLTIKSNVKINSYAFAFCTFSQDILIDSEYINSYAFSNCTIASSIQVSIGKSAIGERAFQNFGGNGQYKLVFHSTEQNTLSIGSYAFAFSKVYGSLVIPWCCNDIKEHAFYNCDRITSLSIDDTNVGASAFEGCTSVGSLTLHSHGNMKTIGQRAFYELQFTSPIEIPSSVSRINNRAFCGCNKSTSLVIPTNSELGKNLNQYDSAIGSYAFCNCTSLKGEAYIPKDVKIIGSYAFCDCTNLQKFTFHNDGLTQIGNFAFNNCTSINGYLDIPKSVTFIGKYAFYNCPKIDSHLFIQSTCTIGEYAFYGCSGITRCDINFKGSTNGFLIGNFAFFGLPIFGDLEIPSNFYYIGESAFEGATTITSVSITLSNYYSDGGIGKRAFYNTGITSIDVNAGGYLVDEFAFGNCLNLKKITIKGGNFNGHVFDGCVNLEPNPDDDNKILTISGGKLGPHNFENCPKFGGTIKVSNYAVIDDNTFEGFRANPIYLDTSSSSNVRIGKRAFYGSSLTGPLYLYNGVKSIGNEAFANCPNMLESLYLGAVSYGKNVFSNSRFNDTLTVYSGTNFDQFTLQGVTGFKTLNLGNMRNVPYRAFYGMSTFEGTLNIPSSVQKIAPYAFSGTGFCDISFTPSYIEIGEGAFSNCKGLNGTVEDFPYCTPQPQEYPITPPSYSFVPEKAFAGCTNLLSITFSGSNVPRIFKRGAFSDCTNLNFDLSDMLTWSNIPDEYTIYKNAFSGCTSMSGVLNIPKQVAKIEDYAFARTGFSYLSFEDRTEITTGDGGGTGGGTGDGSDQTITTIELTLGEGVFSGCNKIVNDIVIPKLSTNEIPDRLFSGCSGIPSIEFPEKLNTIGKYSFSGCSSLHGSLDFSHDITTIKEYAFSGCTGFSDSLIFRVDPANGQQTYIGAHAFDGCKGFKKGSLTFIIETDEENNKYSTSSINARDGSDNNNKDPYFRYKYFLRIGNQAFEDTDFKDVYYNGRFQPDCDYDIGIKHTKGIHTSTNYLNKSFCSYPIHKDKLSGGAIAGITIAVIIVVAAIVVLIIFLIIRNKRNKDQSENEVEMNNDP